MADIQDGQPDQLDRRLILFRRVWALFVLGLLAVTWKLWTPQSDFPQVPLLTIGLVMPRWLDWICLGMVTVALATVLVSGSGRLPRFASGLFIGGMGCLMITDQHRLQPWAFQAILIGVIFATCQARPALRLLRWLTISIYVYSALGKFDYEFTHTLGQQFLNTLMGLLRIPIDFWSEPARVAAACVFPLGELAVGVGLCWSKTRRLATAAADIMHLLLLIILGPWGLGHHLGVLVWNGFFAMQAVMLFWMAGPPPPRDVSAPPPLANRIGAIVGHAVVFAAIVLPPLEMVDRYDHWLAWGLYSPRNSRVTCEFNATAADRLPAELQPFLQVSAADLSRLQLRLDQWSFAALGCPIYPQDRFQAGVVRYVAERYELDDAISARLQSAAARLTGERTTTTYEGSAEIAVLTEQFYFNATPRMPSGDVRR